jgi:hypothetical protein
MGSTMNIIMLAIGGLFLVMYLMRRRSRLRSDD